VGQGDFIFLYEGDRVRKLHSEEREGKMACMKTVLVANIGGKGMMLQKKVNLNWQVGSVRNSIEEQRFASAVKVGVRKVRKKGKQSSAKMVAINEGELVSENSTTVKLSALVAVRNNKVLGSEMVNNLLAIFFPQNHTKALLLQLVSTKLLPGSCYLQFIIFIFFSVVY